MSDLDLLEADVLGADPPAGTAWWKWALGAAGAAGLAYFLVRDLPAGALEPRRVPVGRRPW